jgi:TRAP-type C4-dicarboxylate transport system permease small subunit
MMNKFVAVFDRIITVLMWFACALVVFDMLAVTINVLLRYSINFNFVWLFEITEYSLLWMTFLGTAWILKRNQHVRVDLVVSAMSPRKKEIMGFLAAVLSSILLAGMVWYTAKLTIYDFQMNTPHVTVLEPQKWYLEIIIPIGFLLLLLQMLRNASGHLVRGKSQPQRQESLSEATPGGET